MRHWNTEWITEEDLYPTKRINEEYEDCGELTVWDYWEEDYKREEHGRECI
jgi:hypothetical protein